MVAPLPSGAGRRDASNERPILVVGAGPTGLTAALVLARMGAPVRIIDPGTGPVDESRAIGVHAKTLELLDKLGLAGRAVAGGARVGAVAIYSDGRRRADLTFFEAGDDARTPFPFALIFEQSKTERLLLAGLEEAGGRVKWGTRLERLERLNQGQHDDADGARAVVEGPGGEEIVDASWVIGADGARSPVRHALGLGFAGATYQQTLFLADLDLEGMPEPDRLTFEMTSAGFLGYFPMAGPGHVRVVGNLPPELAERETIALDEMQSILDRHSGLKLRVTGGRWTSVYRTHHRMAERFRVGRVFLAGDAAHIHSPAGGQGMNTGIGDAVNLAWKLALVVRGEARETLLDSYEPERMPFARAILRGSDRGFNLVDATDPLTSRLKLLGVPLLFAALSRPPAMRRRVFWFLSQLWTSYRRSPAVAETGPVGRSPRAGDRAPYGGFEHGPDAGRSIFDLLTGTDHHLLLFAGRRPVPDPTDAAALAIAALRDRFAAPIRLHRIDADEGRLQALYGAEAPTVVLVRPDGHIAYRGAAADVAELARYLDRIFVTRSSLGLPDRLPSAAETGGGMGMEPVDGLVAATGAARDGEG
jgi:2-polyprenyl-6-methoxyphenol hydroxylase-like FAD-dependent oxidoreductase